jgi:hypothetical protein
MIKNKESIMDIQNERPLPLKTSAPTFIHNDPSKRVQPTLIVWILLALLISGCVPQRPRFYSAFIRSDGRIQTNASLDGITWPAESRFIHPESSSFGPGIAATSNGTVALAFFQQKPGTKQQFLVVKQGVGSRIWESLVSGESVSEVDVNSAPAIAHIQDNVFALAWQDGNRIRTATLDANIQQGPKIIGTGVIGSEAAGAPSIAFDGDRALMVWLSKHEDNARGIRYLGRAIGTLVNRRIVWQAIDDLEPPFSPDGLVIRKVVGNPSVTYDGSRFSLATIASIFSQDENSGGGATTYRLVGFESDDGRSFRFIGECNNDLNLKERVDIAMAANNGSAFVMRGPGATAGANGVVINGFPDSCSEVAWSTAFGNQGSPDGQKPAMTYSASRASSP